MSTQNTRIKRLLIAAIVLILLVLVGGFVSIVNKSSKTRLEITVAPSSAQFFIDGRKAATGTQYLATGKHVLKARLTGFDGYSRTVQIDKNMKNKTFNILLTPNTAAGQNYLDDNPALQLEREGLGGLLFGENGRKVTEKYQFLSKLPLVRQRFSVNYGDAVQTKKKDGDVAIALYVQTTDPTEKRNALRTISDALGVTPADIEIIFENYYNPFNTAAE